MPRIPDVQLQARREHILLAAIACFARDGFHKTTMSDIASMAGVSDGLAYRYFSGKDEIIREAVRLGASAAERGDPWTQDGDGDSDGDGDGDGDDTESIIRLLYESSFRRFDHPDRESVVGLRLRSFAEALTSPEVCDHLRERWQDYREVERTLWARAQEDGLVNPDLDPDAVARVLAALHDGLDLQWRLTPDLDVEGCRDVVMAMLTGQLWTGAARENQ